MGKTQQDTVLMGAEWIPNETVYFWVADNVVPFQLFKVLSSTTLMNLMFTVTF